MKEHKATNISAAIIVLFRFHRSTYTPANGPKTACGNKLAMTDSARTSALRVSMLNQKMTA